MGLSSLPGPSEGMLCVILVNTALSISIFKGILRSVLSIIGIRLSPPATAPPPEIPNPEPFDIRNYYSYGFLEEFRVTNPAVKFESLCKNKKQANIECSVCLSKFEEDSEVNNIKCDHLFHTSCLEKWIDFWNVTCPLCRTPLMDVGEEDFAT